MRRYNAIALFVIPILLIGSVYIAQAAWTWVNPTATPPDNGDIQILKADGNDGLGNHIATQDINMTDATAVAHRIYNVGASDADVALVATSTGNAIGGLIYADDNYGAYIKSSSNLGKPAVSARNLLNSASAYALIASSTRGWAAQFGQSLQLATTSGQKAQLQWNAGSPDILSSASNPTPAAKSLYWGTKMLCDATKANCGRVTSSAGDNLGDHQGRFDLNMQSFSLMNVENKIGTTLATSSLQLNHSGTGADSGPGLYAISNSTHGIVASNTIPTSAVAAWGHNLGAGYGVVGSSVAGPGMSLYGRVALVTETANATPPQLTFGPEAEKNSLALQASADPATQNLYWGDSLLCDATANNCGWSAVSGSGSSYWNLVGGNLFTDYLTSIGGIGDSAKLELQTSNLNAVTYSANSHTSKSITLDVQGDRLYVVARDLLKTYSLNKDGIQGFVGIIFMNSSYQQGVTRDMRVIGKYAYVVNQSLKIIDISDPNASSPAVATLNVGGGMDSIYISGNRAYLTGGGASDFAIVDITNPLAPSIVYSANLGFVGADIEVSGRYAYVVAQSGLKVIDIEAATPTIVGSYAMTNGRSVKIRGTVAYVTGTIGANSTIFHAIDVSNPASPTELSSALNSNITTSHQPSDLFIAGNYAYLIELTFNNPQPDYDVTIMDISDPSNVTTVGSREYDNTKGLLRGFLYGHTLFALSYDSDSATTEQVVEVDLPGADFDTLQQGYTLTDDAAVLQSLTAGNIYVGSGLTIGADLNAVSGILNSGKGVINIGGLKLDNILLQKLINWSS